MRKLIIAVIMSLNLVPLYSVSGKELKFAIVPKAEDSYFIGSKNCAMDAASQMSNAFIAALRKLMRGARIR